MTNYSSYNDQFSFSESNLIKNAFDRLLLNVNTMIPCKIISISNDGFYNVQSIVNGLDTLNNPITPNIIYDVPVAFENSSNLSIQHSYNINDVVLVGFCHRNIDNNKTNNWQTQNPANYRVMDINDAIIIRGLFANSNPKITIIADNNGTITINATEVNINSNNANIKSDTINLGNSNLQKVLLESTQFTTTVTGVQAGSDTATGTVQIVSGTPSQTVKAST